MTTTSTSSVDALARDYAILQTCDYIAIRPIIELGDYTAAAWMDQYCSVQIQVGLPGVPSHAYSEMADLAEAIDLAFQLKDQFPHLRLWYDGIEVQAEFHDWRSMALLLAESNEDWEVVERVAIGVLAQNAPEVLEAAEGRPLLAAAVRAVANKQGLRDSAGTSEVSR